jgi:23S rRNA (pseudouridine1915-N3)-methyltransferase
MSLREIDIRTGHEGLERTQLEAERILDELPADAKVVALDERGNNLTSREFATQISNWQDDSCRQLAFVIGGADGLAEDVRRRADKTISFGAATWPHMLVRAMLGEQLFRAASIIAGHPYHRD